MKLWRKHNMQLSMQIREVEVELTFENLYPHMRDETEIERLISKIKALRSSQLTRKEARTHFAPEVAMPSYALWALLKHGGYHVPEGL